MPEQPTLTYKVSPKGGVSVYGLGRFPVTLYYDQWMTLLDPDNAMPLLKFIMDAKASGRITGKDDKPEEGAA